MISKTAGRAKRVMSAAALCAMLAGPLTANAAPALCVSTEESTAFKLRHLQSRLMVAALGCNQQAAYNTFVEHFRDHLVTAGGQLNSYYKRVGGGQTALNRHITDLANAAGLDRAESPTDYCTHAWNLFWSLEQDPQALRKVAEENLFGDIAPPQICSVIVATDLDRKSAGAKNVTAAFDAAKAAAEKSKP